MNVPRDEAARMAQKLEGLGAGIYGLPEPDWKEVVGIRRAVSLYTLLLTLRREKGAVPSAKISYNHGK